MPRFDRTGPMGAGPMTGGARGRCNPSTTATGPAYAGAYGYDRGPGLRRGFSEGYGFGRRRGRRYGRGYQGFPPTAGPGYLTDPAGEVDLLKADADYLQKSLGSIHNRIAELENKIADKS